MLGTSEYICLILLKYGNCYTISVLCEFLSVSIKDIVPSIHNTNIAHDNQYAGTYEAINATRQVRKQKTRQESTNANCADRFNRQRILLAFLFWIAVEHAGDH